MIDVNIIAAWTVVLGFIGGMFSFAILRPLNKTIVQLQAAVDSLKESLTNAIENRHKLELKVAEVDQRARSAHRRLDELVDLYRDSYIDVPKRREREWDDEEYRN